MIIVFKEFLLQQWSAHYPICHQRGLRQNSWTCRCRYGYCLPTAQCIWLQCSKCRFPGRIWGHSSILHHTCRRCSSWGCPYHVLCYLGRIPYNSQHPTWLGDRSHITDYSTIHLHTHCRSSKCRHHARASRRWATAHYNYLRWATKRSRCHALSPPWRSPDIHLHWQVVDSLRRGKGRSESGRCRFHHFALFRSRSRVFGRYPTFLHMNTRYHQNIVLPHTWHRLSIHPHRSHRLCHSSKPRVRDVGCISTRHHRHRHFSTCRCPGRLSHRFSIIHRICCRYSWKYQDHVFDRLRTRLRRSWCPLIVSRLQSHVGGCLSRRRCTMIGLRSRWTCRGRISDRFGIGHRSDPRFHDRLKPIQSIRRSPTRRRTSRHWPFWAHPSHAIGLQPTHLDIHLHFWIWEPHNPISDHQASLHHTFLHWLKLKHPSHSPCHTWNHPHSDLVISKGTSHAGMPACRDHAADHLPIGLHRRCHSSIGKPHVHVSSHPCRISLHICFHLDISSRFYRCNNLLLRLLHHSRNPRFPANLGLLRALFTYSALRTFPRAHWRRVYLLMFDDLNHHSAADRCYALGLIGICRSISNRWSCQNLVLWAF